jgi:hypothetical protein
MGIRNRISEGRKARGAVDNSATPARDATGHRLVKHTWRHEPKLVNVEVAHRPCNRADVASVFGLNQNHNETQAARGR